MLQSPTVDDNSSKSPQTVISQHILIVEDEAIIRADIHLQLDALGYWVVGEACSGQEAVFLTGRLRPDLVLMDIGLGPGMDGIAAAHAIREHQALPVVFLSAYAAEDILERAMLAEPYGYIFKPFSERELHTVLQIALYKHQAHMREAELALRNKVILDNLTNGVLTVELRGVVASINQGACTIFGYAAEEVLGQNVSMLMPERVRESHDSYLQHDESEALGRVICHQRKVSGRRKNGEIFPLRLTVSRLTVVSQASYIVALADISERRLTQDKDSEREGPVYSKRITHRSCSTR
jgi:PAS domain S-box-containing protein